MEEDNINQENEEEIKETENQKVQTKMNPLLVGGIGVLVIAVIAIIFNSTKAKNSLNLSPTQQSVQGVNTDESEIPTEEEMAIPLDITVEGGSYYFKPNEIRVKKGDSVKITFTNTGGMHDFVLDEFNVKTEVLKSNESEIVEFTADKTGTFEFYCSVGNHREMGMKGTLIVQ